MRSNTFPTSLGGKAYDTSVILAWLDHEMLQPSQARYRLHPPKCKIVLPFWSYILAPKKNRQVDPADQIFQNAQYMVRCSNVFFRVLHAAGIWLSESQRDLAFRAGKGMIDTRRDPRMLSPSLGVLQHGGYADLSTGPETV